MSRTPSNPSHIQALGGWRSIAILGIVAWIAVCAPIQSHQLTHFVPSTFSDFYPTYRAAQVSLHGGNPYSETATRSIQTWFYGHPLSAARLTTDREAFVYPGYTAVLFIPLALIPWPILSLILTALWPAMAAFTAWAWVELCAPELGARSSTIALLLMVSSWPAVWACQTMQPTIPAFALVTAACFLLRSRRDALAGLLMTAAAFKPQLIVLLLPWLLLWVVVQRRWKFVFSFTVSAVLLFAMSLFVLPHWISEWQAALRVYTGDDKMPLFVALFGHYVIPVTLACLILIAYVLRDSIRVQADSMRFAEAAAILLAFQLCIIPGGSFWFVYNQVLLFPGALLIVRLRPKGSLQILSSAVANILIELTLLAVPVCATIYLFIGHRPALEFLPAQDIFLPLAITIALLSLHYQSNKGLTEFALWLRVTFMARRCGFCGKHLLPEEDQYCSARCAEEDALSQAIR